MEETSPIHIHKHQAKHDSYRFLAFLVPSIVFATVIVFFLYNRYTPDNLQSQVIAVEQEKRVISIGETQITASVAKNRWDQQKGLSGRTILDANEGMYFPLGKARNNVQFWMKDMLINLDFIWILNNKVAFIHTNVPKPETGTPDNKLPLVIPTNDGGVDGVIEVNAGFVQAHSIAVGDTVSFK